MSDFLMIKEQNFFIKIIFQFQAKNFFLLFSFNTRSGTARPQLYR